MRGICYDGTSWDPRPVSSSLNGQLFQMFESLRKLRASLFRRFGDYKVFIHLDCCTSLTLVKEEMEATLLV